MGPKLSETIVVAVVVLILAVLAVKVLPALFFGILKLLPAICLVAAVGYVIYLLLKNKNKIGQ